MSVTLKHDRGTLITWEVPEVIAPLFTWDARSQLWRAPGQCYRQVVETLRQHGVKHQDQASEFKALELRVSREVQPYRHQTEALAAWKQAGRQGVVVLPTGAGKTFVAQLAMRDTPRSTLICVPTIDLLHQWYSGLLATFPDANIGLLGGGSKDTDADFDRHLRLGHHLRRRAGQPVRPDHLRRSPPPSGPLHPRHRRDESGALPPGPDRHAQAQRRA